MSEEECGPAGIRWNKEDAGETGTGSALKVHELKTHSDRYYLKKPSTQVHYSTQDGGSLFEVLAIQWLNPTPKSDLNRVLLLLLKR